MISESAQMKQDVTSAVNVHLSIFKLVDSIEKRFHAGTPVKDMDEVKRLRAGCASECALESSAACLGLVRLVRCGVLPPLPTASALLASVFSVKQLCGVTSALVELCLLGDGEGKREGEEETPHHPLVLLLRRRPLACPDLLNHMWAVCCHPDQRVREVGRTRVVRPVLAHILTEANDLPASCRLQAFNMVSHHFSDSPFLVDTLAASLCWGDQRVLEAVQAVCRLAEEEVEGRVAPLCCLALCSLLPRLLRLGHSPLPALTTLTRLCPPHSHLIPTVLAALAPTLPACPAHHLPHLLAFMCNVVASVRGDCAWMCVSGLLPWLACPAPLPPATSRLMDLVASAPPTTTPSAAALMADAAFATVVSADPRLTRALLLARLSEQLVDEETCLEWLGRLKVEGEQVYHYCCALLLSGGRGSVRVRLAALRAILSADPAPAGASHTVTVLLYQLAREKEAQVQLELLRGLPHCATDKSVVGAVLGTLGALHSSGHPRLALLAVDLHARLWLAQPRCHPQLVALLNTPAHSIANDYGDPSLLRLLHAAICCLICNNQPEKHGKEAVLKVSELVGGGGGGRQAGLALNALEPLCRCDVVDVYSVWRSLAPRFANDKRSPIINSLCRLASVAASQKPSCPEAEDTRGQMLRWLWGQVEGTQPSAALKALSVFRLDQMHLKQLPANFRKDLKLPPELASTPIDAARKPEDVLDYIPGECLSQLLEQVGTQEASETVSCWIKTEIASFKSRFYQVDRAEPTSYQHLPRASVVRAVTTSLQRECGAVGGSDFARVCLHTLVLGAVAKPLPALAWSFLSPLDNHPDVLRLAAKQSQISPSARKITERFINDAGSDKNKIELLYTVLEDLGRGIPPTILRPFLERTLQTALIDQDKKHFCTIIEHVENTLKEGKIHDANKSLLNLLVKNLWDLIDVDNQSEWGECCDALLGCMVVLPESQVEAACSVSLMWEVTPARLRKALRLRAKMALQPNQPLHWIDEMVEVAAEHIAEQRLALELITQVIREVGGQGHQPTWAWLLQLMGQAHTTATKDGVGVGWMAAVFASCVDVMAHSQLGCLSVCADDTEATALRFPQAVALLVAKHGDATTMLEWLTHMASLESLPSQLAAQFQLAARNLLLLNQATVC